ncbi:5'-methylthioadenosine/adenosylhomocysteine nucleosidase [Aerococcus kribbianus]|uniref:adenosylhomocysteine nucleosidase n=1 Tax=Aerococcus kribbianus TaxID=2999064 RepID=A0A9X3JGW5_9LACT|nr:5'-methylthioadenosine/adenosylhomocysteine nucleosidase [Aerococcus sp. YH-aer222]MCZ0725984.1 5'-methylthioadenosine/adenosylhomocysteine nucleosidase [Aerococcus sp. YH-aer222]
MKIAIIAAMQAEITYYRKHLMIEKEHHLAHLTWWEATFKGHQIIFVESGIGKVNAAIAATVLAQETPDLLINSGSAGAVNPELSVGDIVISDATRYHDADAQAFGYEPGQIPQMPAEYPTSQQWSQAIEKVFQSHDYTVHSGLVLTGDSFIADNRVLAQIKADFPRAQCTEMEGAAIAQVAYQFNIPCLIIRAISDTASQDANILFDEFIDQAGKNSAKLTLDFISQI